MADVLIANLGTGSAPLDYELSGAQEIILRSIRASFDGSGAAASFLPAVQITDGSGNVVATYPVANAVAAGASADVSWFPGVNQLAAGSLTNSVVSTCVRITSDHNTGAGPTSYVIPWDAIVYDTSGGAIWNSGAKTDLVAPTTGIYHVMLMTTVVQTSGAEILCGIDTTGAPFGIDVGSGVFTTGTTLYRPMSYITKMTAGDIATGEVNTNTAAAVTISAGIDATFMALTRLA